MMAVTRSDIETFEQAEMIMLARESDTKKARRPLVVLRLTMAEAAAVREELRSAVYLRKIFAGDGMDPDDQVLFPVLESALKKIRLGLS